MGRVMHSTADELRGMGHTVDLLFSGDVPRRGAGASDRLVFPVALVGTIRKCIRERGRYDVVEIHEPSAAWYCFQRKRDKILPPCVVMSHGLEETQWQLRQKLDRSLGRKTSRKSKLLVPLTLLSQARYGLKQCQQVMCLNSFDQQYLHSALKIPSEKITLVQNGVSPLFFDDQPTHIRRGKSLLFVGSWLERKGTQTLAEAFAWLHKSDPEVSLTLAGVGFPENEVLRSFPHELHASICVIPSASDLQLRDLYYEHSVFVFPSYFEPWGLVLMEAAAAGMAIVTTNVGGPKDLFSNGEDALLIPVTDPKALVSSIQTLLQDDKLRERLSRAAQERARQFTWAAAAQSHLRAYERVLAHAGSKI